MTLDRRKFLKSVTAAGALFTGLPRLYPMPLPGSDESPKPSVAVLLDPSFPASEEIPVSQELLAEGLEGCTVTYLTASELSGSLTPARFDLFINPYGSFFPREGFHAIQAFLTAGKNWINLGGVPFGVPLDRKGGEWQKETQQTAYHQLFGITQSFPVRTERLRHYRENVEFPLAKRLLDGFTVSSAYALYYKFSESKDYPDEDGSAGPRDAVVRPLVLLQDQSGVSICAPIVLVDRHLGACSGGRWILATFAGTLKAAALRTLVELALEGATEVTVRPALACYYIGERPTFTVSIRQKSQNHKLKGRLYLAVIKGDKDVIWRTEKGIDSGISPSVTSFHLPANFQHLGVGSYAVEVRFEPQGANQRKGVNSLAFNGFWVRDDEIISNRAGMKAGASLFLRDGVPYPVTGTTYMGSDVHRKFLSEPNPYVWDNDFHHMKECGINMLRTGIWTGWKSMMPDAGAPVESYLRAMDAFVLTALRHDIPVIFTFFAFLPESWGGLNAYLDPRSINAQKEFVTAFVRRYRGVDSILWDLINEPSFCNPKHLWECRPNYDRYESAKWEDWKKGIDSSYADRYRLTDETEAGLPSLEDFDDVNIVSGRHPTKVVDYRLFAQDQFAAWAQAMAQVIREEGNPRQLITVGQDEGGTGESPGNHFFAGAVDFTSLHNWWLNDDLVWDSVMTRVPGKANLVEETGVMFYERMDARPWRTEEDARNLLERKLAIAFGTGSAGSIEWIWNSNPYMPSDNEAAIGLHRADGSAKPEYDVVRSYATYFHENSKRMRGEAKDDLYMVIPHTQLYSSRNLATKATKRCVRTLAYQMGIVPAAVSEYRLDDLRGVPRVLIMPSPQVIARECWDRLMKLVDGGATLVLSGPFDLDERWTTTGRPAALGLALSRRPVTEAELLRIAGSDVSVPYRGTSIERVEKDIVESQGVPEPLRITRGKGEIVWCPLPVELADSQDAVLAFYRMAIEGKSGANEIALKEYTPSVLCMTREYDDAVLCALVSECDRDMKMELVHRRSARVVPVTVRRQRTALLFVDRQSGEILSSMNPET